VRVDVRFIAASQRRFGEVVCPSVGAHPASRAFWRGRCVQLTGAATGSVPGAAAA
jgi:hypothetical protein